MSNPKPKREPIIYANNDFFRHSSGEVSEEHGEGLCNLTLGEDGSGYGFYKQGKAVRHTLSVTETSVEVLGHKLEANDACYPAKLIDAKNGDIYLRARNGTIYLDAKDIIINSTNNVTILSGNNIKVDASNDLSLNAGRVKIKSSLNTDLISGMYTNFVGGVISSMAGNDLLSASLCTPTSAIESLGKLAT